MPVILVVYTTYGCRTLLVVPNTRSLDQYLTGPEGGVRTRRAGPAPDTPDLAPTRSATTEPRRGSRTRASRGIRSHRLSRVASTIAPTSPTRPEIGAWQISTRAPVGSSAAPRRAAPRDRLVDSPTVAAAYDVQAPRSGPVSRQVDSSARRVAAADTTTAAASSAPPPRGSGTEEEGPAPELRAEVPPGDWTRVGQMPGEVRHRVAGVSRTLVAVVSGGQGRVVQPSGRHCC